MIPWYKSQIIQQQVVSFILALIALLGLTTDIDVAATVAAIFAGIGAIIPLVTIATRLFKPSPNLTQTAVKKEKELKKEGTIK